MIDVKPIYRILSNIFGAIGLFFATIAIWFEDKIHEEDDRLASEHIKYGMGEWRG